jgi:hypothetical protein
MTTPRKKTSRVIAPTPRKRAVRLVVRESLVPSSHAQRTENVDEHDDSHEFVDEDDAGGDDPEHLKPVERPQRPENPATTIRPSTCDLKHDMTKYYWQYGNHIDEWDEDKGDWTVCKWQCKMCPSVKQVLGTTSNQMKHLAEKHEIFHPDKPRKSTKPPPRIPRIDNYKIDATKLKTALTAHFCADHVPFHRIESPSFRNLLRIINPQVDSVLPKCADTIRKATMDIFGEKMPIVGTVLCKLDGLVHISFDGWTSDSGDGFQGIVGYIFINCESKGLPVLLAMKEVEGKHSGANIASCISKTLEQYQIKDKIGYYVLDNASNNDSAIDNLEGIESGKRLRCILHIINLCVRALFASKSGDNSDEHEPATKWKRHQAIEKLQAIAKRILNSPNWKKKYGQEFKTMIKMENSTRWNSVYDMISSVLGKEMVLNRFVRMMIEETAEKKEKRKLENSILTAEDWEVLHEINRILEPFKTSTAVLQGYLHRVQ